MPDEDLRALGRNLTTITDLYRLVSLQGRVGVQTPWLLEVLVSGSAAASVNVEGLTPLDTDWAPAPPRESVPPWSQGCFSRAFVIEVCEPEFDACKLVVALENGQLICAGGNAIVAIRSDNRLLNVLVRPCDRHIRASDLERLTFYTREGTPCSSTEDMSPGPMWTTVRRPTGAEVSPEAHARVHGDEVRGSLLRITDAPRMQAGPQAIVILENGRIALASVNNVRIAPGQLKLPE